MYGLTDVKKHEEINDVSYLAKYVFKCTRPFQRFQPIYHDGKPQVDTYKKVWTKCGTCNSCRTRRKKEITGRSLAEATLHPTTSFITLTYDEQSKPTDLQTGYKDVQLWLKSLRNHSSDIVQYADSTKRTHNIPKGLRYLAAGELAPKTFRPHWHCLLFGTPAVQPPNTGKPWKLQSRAWPHGFITWESATVSRIAYACSYSVKKTDEHLSFWQSSLKPGLGQELYQRLGKQAFHRGKLPQDIQSLQTGKSFWPLDATARNYITQGFLEAAEQSDQLTIATNRLYSRDVENRLNYRYTVQMAEQAIFGETWLPGIEDE